MAQNASAPAMDRMHPETFIRIPGPAFGEHDEGIEECQAVLGCGRQVAADGAELAGAGEGAQAAGYFLFH